MKYSWLPGLDSNQGFQLQRLTCYPYTTGQRARAAHVLAKVNNPRLIILRRLLKCVKRARTERRFETSSEPSINYDTGKSIFDSRGLCMVDSKSQVLYSEHLFDDIIAS